MIWGGWGGGLSPSTFGNPTDSDYPDARSRASIIPVGYRRG